MLNILSRIARSGLLTRAPERKDSRAGALIAMHSIGRPRWTPRDVASLAREGYERNAVVYRCVRMISETAASVPWLLYQDRAELTDHPLLRLATHPNSHEDGATFWEAVFGHLLVAGDAYLEAALIDGAPRELYTLRPDRMQVVPGPRGWPMAYDYVVGAERARYDQTQGGVRPILHLKMFAPLDDHYGFSPISAAQVPLDIHNAAGAWNKALLDNAARPSGALVYSGDGHLSDDQFERLKAELEESFSGQRNAGRPLLLEGGLDWKALSLSPKDMDFMQAKAAAAREIALAFGVPPMILGLPGDNTFSNYSEANRAFWRQTVIPLVKRAQRAMEGWLGDAFEPGLRFDIDADKLDALAEDRAREWTRIGQADFLTRDEKREAAGYGDKGRLGGKGYNPDQPRAPAGTPEGGQWTNGEAEPTRPFVVAQNDEPRLTVDLREHEGEAGGHAIRKHVGLTEMQLRGELDGTIIRARTASQEITSFQDAWGTFGHLSDANSFVSDVLSENEATVRKVGAGEMRAASLSKRYGYTTGIEAYRESSYDLPVIRQTYAVEVVIQHRADLKSGFIVKTAYPFNERPHK